MKRLFSLAVRAAAPVLIVVLLAGCGGSSSGSSKSSSAARYAPPATTSTAAATTTSSTSTAAATPAAVSTLTLTTKRAEPGTILAAGNKKLTVYLFEADKGSQSACSGACESVWPPVTAAAMPNVSGAAVSADLGTITRSDGTKQVTYKGHPLYFYAKDKDDEDAYGQGVKSFGAGWYVLRPNGSKIDDDDDKS